MRTDANRSCFVRRFETESPEPDHSSPVEALGMNKDVCVVVGVDPGNGAAIARQFVARAFAFAEAAQRSLAESMARSLWPAGIYAATVIIGGEGDLTRPQQGMPDKPDSFYVQPDSVAATVSRLSQK